jgi:hypothetical protein
MLEKSYPQRAKELGALAQSDIETRWKMYEHLARGNDSAVQK